jgi:3-deoxy-7-phosphoheptulonate synthase
MIEQVEAMGLKPNVLRGTERTVVAAIGDERIAGELGQLERAPGVDQVMRVLAPYKLASIETQPTRSVIRAGSLEVGGKAIGTIAGPCSVENEEQIVATAQQVKLAGATALRGGAFKPRTSPYSFQGLKEEGLKLLAMAREETGLGDCDRSRRLRGCQTRRRVCGCTANRRAQHAELSAARSGRPDESRGAAEAWPERDDRRIATAAEYILDEGNPNVMLCERGIRTFEAHTRFTLPLATVPYLQAQDALAGGGRSQSRHRAHAPRRCNGQGRCCRRCRRADYRGSPRPGTRVERRLSDARLRGVRPPDARLPPRR